MIRQFDDGDKIDSIPHTLNLLAEAVSPYKGALMDQSREGSPRSPHESKASGPVRTFLETPRIAIYAAETLRGRVPGSVCSLTWPKTCDATEDIDYLSRMA